MTKALQKYHSDQLSEIGPLPKTLMLLRSDSPERMQASQTRPVRIAPNLRPGLSFRRDFRHVKFGVIEQRATSTALLKAATSASASSNSQGAYGP